MRCKGVIKVIKVTIFEVNDTFRKKQIPFKFKIKI